MRLKYGRTQVFDDYSAVMYNLNVNRDLARIFHPPPKLFLEATHK
jgi:hypothetical protein